MLNALIADSDPQARYVLRRVLVGEWGLGIFETDNGMATLEQLAANAFRLLFLDINLPLFDGLQVLELIRSKPQMGDVPVVMTGSAIGQPAMRRLLELGISDYLRKPLQPERLIQRLAGVVNRALGRTPAVPSTHSWPSEVLADRNALVVDGDAGFRSALIDALQADVPTLGVSTGTDAVRAVGFQPPDLVFVGEDIGMLSGPMLTRKLLSVPACHACYMVAVLPSHATVEGASSPFHARMPRNTESAVLKRDVAAILSRYRARTHFARLVPELSRQVLLVAADVFSLLVPGGVRVTRIASLPADTSSAATDIHLPESGVVVQCRVLVEPKALADVACRLGIVPPETSEAPGDADSVFEECLQLLSTRLANWIDDAGFRVERRGAVDSGADGAVAQVQVSTISGEPAVRLFVGVDVT